MDVGFLGLMLAPPFDFPLQKMVMDAQAKRARLLKIDAEWAAIASGGRDVAFWTDDAIVIAPQLVATDCTVSADGSLAYMFSSNTVTADDPAGLPATTLRRAVTIWRREGDGRWRCAVDIWN